MTLTSLPHFLPVPLKSGPYRREPLPKGSRHNLHSNITRWSFLHTEYARHLCASNFQPHSTECRLLSIITSKRSLGPRQAARRTQGEGCPRSWSCLVHNVPALLQTIQLSFNMRPVEIQPFIFTERMFFHCSTTLGTVVAAVLVGSSLNPLRQPRLWVGEALPCRLSPPIQRQADNTTFCPCTLLAPFESLTHSS